MKQKAAALLLSAVMCLTLLAAAAPHAMAYKIGYDGMGPQVLAGGQRDFLWPVPGHCNIQGCFYDHRNHCALDIAAPTGTPIVASYDGVVVAAGNLGDGFGNFVALRHDYKAQDGTISPLYSRYSHMNSISVRTGTAVTAGVTQLGTVGATGKVTGPHLDFQILVNDWDNYKVNSIDPYANELLELPENLQVLDAWNCGWSYYSLVRAQYAILPAPTRAVLTTDRSDYAAHERVTFRMDGDGTSNSLFITGPDGTAYEYHMLGDTYQLSFEAEGAYQALIETRNTGGSFQSEPVTFTVTRPETPPEAPENPDQPAVSDQGEPSEPIPNPFEDVAQENYFCRSVLWAVSQTPQITNGTDDTHFSPNNTCTRAEAVTFLWRAAGEPEPTTAENPFADVQETDYFCKAVLWAVENEITNGTSATTFAPAAPCTRAHVVTFLWRSANVPAAQRGEPFSDVSDGTFYTGAVLWATAKGITNGTDDTHFSPGSACTRGQIVTFLFRDMGDPAAPESESSPKI